MVIVDTSVWIDHLHSRDPQLAELLERGEVLTHAIVRGELALGRLKDRRAVLDAMARLPAAAEASSAEVEHLIENRRLFGRGLNLVDAHLLAGLLLTPEATLWTRDKALAGVVSELSRAF